MEKTKDDIVSNKYGGLKKQLSEAGSYSYAAICAISLNELYGTECDMPYSKECIKKFVKHLQLPKQVFETMDSLVSGYGSQSYQAYVELLMAEPAVKSNPILVIQDLVLFGIETGQYDARSRVLVMHVATLLGAPHALAQLAEENLGHSLLSSAKQQTTQLSPEQQQLAKKKQRTRKFKRYALIGLATVGGGALLGVTGGLAAPFIGAGIGTIIGGGAAAAAIGSVAGAAIVGSLFGLAGAGLTGYRMKRRVGEIEEFEFGRLSDSEEQLHIAIAVSGWLNETDDNFVQPWRSLHSSREQYYLRYESTYLRELGNAMDLLVKAAMSSAVKEMLKHTILRGLLAAIAWPASLLSLSHIIDNPWGTCLRRSAQVGRHLAEVLLTRQHGGRPVTLVGFSLGARVIFYCLRELADRMPGSEGIVQDVVMLGAPVTGSTKDWTDIASVVAGKIVNGYCRTDWLLKFLYRTTSVQVTIAGLNPIECDSKRIRNVDLSDSVSGHQEYIHKIDVLLKIVGVRTSNVNVKRSMSAAVVSDQSPVSLSTSQSLPAGLTMLDGQVSDTLPILEDSNEDRNSLSTWFVSNDTSNLAGQQVADNFPILEEEDKVSLSHWFLLDDASDLTMPSIKCDGQSNVVDDQSTRNPGQFPMHNEQDIGQIKVLDEQSIKNPEQFSKYKNEDIGQSIGNPGQSSMYAKYNIGQSNVLDLLDGQLNMHSKQDLGQSNVKDEQSTMHMDQNIGQSSMYDENNIRQCSVFDGQSPMLIKDDIGQSNVIDGQSAIHIDENMGQSMVHDEQSSTNAGLSIANCVQSNIHTLVHAGQPMIVNGQLAGLRLEDDLAEIAEEEEVEEATSTEESV